MKPEKKKAYIQPAIEEEVVFVPESSACEWMPQSVYLSHHSGEACGDGIHEDAEACAPVKSQWWHAT